MPGLVGIFSNKKIEPHLFDRMISSIKHDSKYKTDRFAAQKFALARVHLGIFNPEPQPIYNKDKSLCIFMDGKIYGYEDQKKDLIKKGYKFKIKNDAEFCLYLFEEKGIDFVKELNGDFIIAICDLKRKEYYLFNDRHGSRPHYYILNNRTLLFAPEIKAILQYKSYKKELNIDAVVDFLAVRYLLGNKTFFRGINTLPPASILKYDGKVLIKEQYWNFEYAPDYSKSENEFADTLVKKFKKAVQVRMEEAVRYGLSLSGGVDSRSIISSIDKNKQILAFSFGVPNCDDVKIAKKVAKKNRTKFKSINWHDEQHLNPINMQNLVWFTEGHDFVGIGYLLYVIKEIENDLDVILGDLANGQLLGGCYLYEEVFKIETEEQLINFLNKKIRIFSENDLKELCTEQFYKKIQDKFIHHLRREIENIKSTNLVNKNDAFFRLNYQRRFNQFGWVLSRIKKEVALPCLDNNYINTILTVPPELRANYKLYRKFLKKLSPSLAKIPYNLTMVRADAPRILWIIGCKVQTARVKIKKLIWRFSGGMITLRNKRSYVDFDELFRTNKKWRSYFQELLLSKNSLSGKYLNKTYIKRLFYEHMSGKKDTVRKILYLATFELVLRLFFNERIENTQ